MLLMVFGLIGSGLLLSGLARYADAKRVGPSLDKRRATLLGSFRSVLTRWDETRPILEQQSLRVNLSLPDAVSRTINLTLSDEVEHILSKQTQAVLPEWHPLSFRAGKASIGNPLPKWQSPLALRVEIEARSHNDWVRLAQGTLDLTTVTYSKSASWKDCINLRHGSFRPGNCTVLLT